MRTIILLYRVLAAVTFFLFVFWFAKLMFEQYDGPTLPSEQLVPLLISAAVGFLLTIVTLLALAEIIKLFIDIESNTRLNVSPENADDEDADEDSALS